MKKKWMNETSGFDNIADRSKKNTFKKRFWLPYKCRHGFVTSLQFFDETGSCFFILFHFSFVIFLCEQRCEYERKNTPPKINKRNQRQKKNVTNWKWFLFLFYFLVSFILMIFLFIFIWSLRLSALSLHFNAYGKQRCCLNNCFFLPHSNVNAFYLLAWHLSSNRKHRTIFQITWKSFHFIFPFFFVTIHSR